MTLVKRTRPSLYIKQRRRVSTQRFLAQRDLMRHRFELGLERDLRAVFKSYGRRASSEFLDTTQTQVADAMLPVDLGGVLNRHYGRVIPFFGRDTLNVLQKQDDAFFRMVADDYIFTLGAVAVSRVSSATKGFIRVIISEGVEAGLGTEAIAKNITRALIGGRRAILKARTVARTEVHNASTYASHETAKSLDIPDLQKRWVATLSGGRTRANHLAVHGQVVPLNEQFMVPSSKGVDLMDYPGDPNGSAENVIQCRCDVVYVEPGTVVTP